MTPWLTRLVLLLIGNLKYRQLKCLTLKILVMFFVLHLLILVISEVSNSNSFSIKREIKPDGKYLTENENLFKLEDGVRNADSTHINHNSLFEAVQNVSLPVSTTQNLKADLLDKMLSEEMFSMKEFIYKNKKLSTPSLEIKQKWPVLELMAKLNNINADDYDDPDIDVLEKNKNIGSTGPNLVHIRMDQGNVTVKYASNKTETTVSTTHKSQTYLMHTMPTTCTSTTIEERDELQARQLEETNLCESKLSLKQENLKHDDRFQKKVIELRSLKHHKRNKSNVRSDGTDTKYYCSCKSTKGNVDHRTKCTASMHYLNNNNGNIGMTSSYCTSSCKEPRHCASEPDSTTKSSVTYCPTQQTTCYPIPTTTYYTTCYTIYPTPAPSYGSSVNYQSVYPPYFYQPYPMFVPPLDIPPKQKEYKRPKHKKPKTYIDDELYYEDSLPKYDDYLDNPVKNEPKVDNDFREVILQQHDSIAEKSCTQGVDNSETNNFVSEVVNDLKKFYGDSVLKNCYCGFRSSASAIAPNITLSIFLYCFTHFLNIFLFY